MMTPLAMADALRIGNVDFVSPDEIKVIIDIEAPNDVALNIDIGPQLQTYDINTLVNQYLPMDFCS